MSQTIYYDLSTLQGQIERLKNVAAGLGQYQCSPDLSGCQGESAEQLILALEQLNLAKDALAGLVTVTYEALEIAETAIKEADDKIAEALR